MMSKTLMPLACLERRLTPSTLSPYSLMKSAIRSRSTFTQTNLSRSRPYVEQSSGTLKDLTSQRRNLDLMTLMRSTIEAMTFPTVSVLFLTTTKSKFSLQTSKTSKTVTRGKLVSNIIIDMSSSFTAINMRTSPGSWTSANLF